jgi:hypothetical protein
MKDENSRYYTLNGHKITFSVLGMIRTHYHSSVKT